MITILWIKLVENCTYFQMLYLRYHQLNTFVLSIKSSTVCLVLYICFSIIYLQKKVLTEKENMTNIHIEGCVYSTYSPCDGNQIPHMGGKINCIYCNHKDGCNSASQSLQNVILIKVIIFTVYLICY